VDDRDEFYGHWHLMISSPSKEIFTQRLAEFELKYVTKYLQEVGYIKTSSRLLLAGRLPDRSLLYRAKSVSSFTLSEDFEYGPAVLKSTLDYKYQRVFAL
jgi:hypothetical protein